MEAMSSIQSLDLSDRGNQFVRFMKEGAMGKVRSYHALAGGLLAVLLAMGASNVGATPMLDQIYFDPKTNIFSSGSSADNNFRRAQTFTVDLAGVLDHVDMRGAAGSSMRILATTGGVPTFTVLASTRFRLTTGDGWISWDLSSSGLSVVPGEVLAMDMLGGSWFGHVPGGYAGGADYFLNVLSGFPNFTLNRDHPDSFIRTFVDVPQPAPEPASSVGLLGLGLAGLGFVRGYRWLQRKERVGRLERVQKGISLGLH
jgi:hypothetical protein